MLRSAIPVLASLDIAQSAAFYEKERGFTCGHQEPEFGIDPFEGELEGLILCSVEVEGLEELMRIEPPAFVHREVTEDRFFTGGSLSRINRRELMEKLATPA